MQDNIDELLREEETIGWQEEWFGIPGDVDDFIFYGYDDPEGRSGR